MGATHPDLEVSERSTRPTVLEMWRRMLEMVLVGLWVPGEQRLQGLPGADPVCFGALFWSDVVHAHRPARGFPHILTQSFFSSLCTTCL